MTALPHLSAIRFSGADAGDFIHNQVSADVLALTQGESTFACYCEPKGRVLALMLICRLDEDYCVIMASSMAATIADRLKIYVMRSKVTIEVLTGYTVSGVQTVDAPEASSISIATIQLPHSDRWLVVNTDEYTPDSDPSAQDRWKISELQSGITWLCPETAGQFLPQMLGFDQLGAVNFRKGCYPGQEIVARTHYLGKVKRYPRLLCTSAVICPDPLDVVQIIHGEESYDAVIVDCGHGKEGSSYLMVITRMNPELSSGTIEYQGQIAPLI